MFVENVKMWKHLLDSDPYKLLGKKDACEIDQILVLITETKRVAHAPCT